MHLPDDVIASWVADARARTLGLVEDLDDDQLMGPRLAIVNPMLWEIGHVAWFQERWVLRVAHGEPPMRDDGDALYDSSAIPHDTRWDLPLPSRAETLHYLNEVRDRVLDRLARRAAMPEERYYLLLSIFHEDMHDEAFSYTRQTLGYAPPPGAAREGPAAGALAGDAEIAGGEILLGSTPGEEPFLFDNEKWAHPVSVAPFAMARAPVTQGELVAFAEDGGYAREALWSPSGWAWRTAGSVEHPRYLEERDGRWMRRDFDRWVPVESHRAAIHVGWYEAEAYCRWAQRRLPTEAEWELAARGVSRRRFPWGEAGAASRANLDGVVAGTVDAGAFAEGDSPEGVRQLIGNTWEWTSTDFAPYPGFSADPYEDYSRPWFGDHKVLRGGCWATRSRMIRSAYRNFYKPGRNDVFAGFRTCALR